MICFIQPRKQSEWGCTKSYRGLLTNSCMIDDHFLSLGDHHWKSSFWLPGRQISPWQRSLEKKQSIPWWLARKLQWFELVYEVGVLIDDLASLMATLSFSIFWTLCGIFEVIFAFSCQFNGQSCWIDNHAPNRPYIYVAKKPFCLFIHLLLTILLYKN